MVSAPATAILEDAGKELAKTASVPSVLGMSAHARQVESLAAQASTQDWVITSQINPVTQTQATLFPPVVLALASAEHFKHSFVFHAQ